ncbi:MAG TPA: DUF1571 domain-containing protein [Bacteroidia bacterium]|jgi:hypothetical protein|nr:DUF1571 domain-containing protein [Bacteroidia bacterium]
MRTNTLTRKKTGFSMLLIMCGIALNAQVKNDVETVFNRMFDSISRVKTMVYKLHSEERINEKLINENFTIKYNASPFEVYNKNDDNGVEVLYKNSESKALVNPNGFPYADLHLDPKGKLMRQNQHQILTRTGLSYFGNIIQKNLASDSYNKNVHYQKDTVWEGKPCYKVEILFPDYKYINYTVKNNGETISGIAEKYLLSDYKIVALNKNLWYDDELKAGQTVVIPSKYAKRAVLIIRKDNYLPTSIEVYDDKGLFEKYSFTNMYINTRLPEIDFASTNSSYHF